ncbi:MAG: photosynthetic reaction center cytochrome c subunit [Alphaproteobacteria bacterium]|nr:photosynthetic reaction center cytochrome c subunit [Alphaproteobacteria bacterium]
MIGFGTRIAVVVGVLLGVAVVFTTFGFPPVNSTQTGPRGTGMAQLGYPGALERLKAANVMPEALPESEPSGEKSSAVYENVQVLKDLDSNEFLRVMQAMTEWVAPQEGCAYCHEDGNLASDKPYQKIVARRMLQMTIDLNKNWSAHVAETGVTCYTCHRGNPVPADIWFMPSQQSKMATNAGGRPDGQNAPSASVGLTSMPANPFASYLLGNSPIRVQPDSALPKGQGASIQATEGTYGLMMHMSDALGVNCTACHNTQALKSWKQNGTIRAKAWHGIRMVRELNKDYLVPLTSTFPASRLGHEGDVAKINCATCHQGANKPLLGQSMVRDYLASLRP